MDPFALHTPHIRSSSSSTSRRPKYRRSLRLSIRPSTDKRKGKQKAAEACADFSKRGTALQRPVDWIGSKSAAPPPPPLPPREEAGLACLSSRPQAEESCRGFLLFRRIQIYPCMDLSERHARCWLSTGPGRVRVGRGERCPVKAPPGQSQPREEGQMRCPAPLSGGQRQVPPPPAHPPQRAVEERRV